MTIEEKEALQRVIQSLRTVRLYCGSELSPRARARVAELLLESMRTLNKMAKE